MENTKGGLPTTQKGRQSLAKKKKDGKRRVKSRRETEACLVGGRRYGTELKSQFKMGAKWKSGGIGKKGKKLDKKGGGE